MGLKLNFKAALYYLIILKLTHAMLLNRIFLNNWQNIIDISWDPTYDKSIDEIKLFWGFSEKKL